MLVIPFFVCISFLNYCKIVFAAENVCSVKCARKIQLKRGIWYEWKCMSMTLFSVAQLQYRIPSVIKTVPVLAELSTGPTWSRQRTLKAGAASKGRIIDTSVLFTSYRWFSASLRCRISFLRRVYLDGLRTRPNMGLSVCRQVWVSRHKCNTMARYLQTSRTHPFRLIFLTKCAIKINTNNKGSNLNILAYNVRAGEDEIIKNW